MHSSSNSNNIDNDNCRKNHPVFSFYGANCHRQEDCKSDTPCCANCSGCHLAHSKECPKWQVEHQVQKITSQHGVSFAEARRMLSGVDSTCDDLPKRSNVTTTSVSVTRNVVLESTDTNKSLFSLSPFLLSKTLQAAISTITSVKRFCTGHTLVTINNPIYSQKLLQLTELAGVSIKASPHRTPNNSKGVVRCGELKQYSNEEIGNELAPQGVTNSVNIKPKGGTVRNTFILSFSTPSPPKIIIVRYLKKPVNIYIPNPVRCFVSEIRSWPEELQ